MSGNLSLLWSRFQGLHRAFRISAYATITYLIYALILGVVTPYAVKQIAPEKLTELLGRTVSVADVRINPFILDFEISGVAVEGEDKPLTSLERVGLQLNFWQSIFNAELNVDYLHIDGLYTHISREQESPLRFNFSDIVERFASASSSEEPTVAVNEELIDRKAPIFPVYIGALQLNSAALEFEDRVTNTALAYPDIQFSMDGFSTQYLLSNNESLNQFRFSVTDIDNGSVTLVGHTQLKPLKLNGHLDVSSLQLPRFWGFVDELVQARLSSGQLALSTHFSIEQILGDTEAQDQLLVLTNEGELQIQDLVFSHSDKPFISLPEFSVHEVTSDIAKQEVDIANIVALGLDVKARLKDGELDLADWFTPRVKQIGNVETTKPESGPIPEPEKETGWIVKLGGSSFNDFNFDIRENIATPEENHWNVSPINLTLGSFVSDLSVPLEFELSTGLNRQGNLAAKGKVDLNTLEIDAESSINKLALKQFQPFVDTAVNATINDGVLSTNTKVTRTENGNILATGSASVDRLSVQDNRLKTPFVKWQKLALSEFKFDLNKLRLDVDMLELSKPYARVIINEDSSTNIGELIIANGEESEEGKNAKETPANSSDTNPFLLNVKRINFKDGSAFFADNSLTPNFATGIELLNGEIANISSKPGTTASVDVRGSIDKYAPVTIVGDINPLIPEPHLDLDVKFDSVELTTVNPYSGTYAGHYIDRGQLTLALNYQLEESQLKGTNHVIIDQLELGEASDSELATSLPLELAIALLQDTDGVIDLGVEVSGDVNDPEFGIGTVILTAITNVIEKAVTAPFSFIAGLAGSDEELNIVEFDAGSDELSDEQQQKLMTLATALNERPKLNISVDGAVDEKQDSQALIQDQFNAILAEGAGLTSKEIKDNLTASSMPTTGKASDFLKSLYADQTGKDSLELKAEIEADLVSKSKDVESSELEKRWHIAMYNTLLNEQELRAGELGKLAQKRAQMVKAYLVKQEKVPASRIFLRDSRFDIEKDASQVTLTLEP